ncbi:MAG: lipoprotein [Anaerolineae bacterium]
MKRWLLIIAFLIVTGLIAACGADGREAAPQAEVSQSAPAPARSNGPAFTTQSNGERAVSVDVTPLNLASGGDTLEFEVAFNTHSVDLSFDPAAISVLRDGQGREYPAIAWEGSGPGGHHRSGVLRFQVPDRASDFVEVVIHDVAGVPERVFHWDLDQ